MKVKPLELGLSALFIALIVLIGWLVGSDATRETAKNKESRPARQQLVTQQPAESKNSGNTPVALPKTENASPSSPAPMSGSFSLRMKRTTASFSLRWVPPTFASSVLSIP